MLNRIAAPNSAPLCGAPRRLAPGPLRLDSVLYNLTYSHFWRRVGWIGRLVLGVSLP
jgi:hypothetical protein